MFDISRMKSRKGFPTLLNEMGLAGDAVEIGTHTGIFAAMLLKGWTPNTLYCVDPYSIPEGYEWQANQLEHSKHPRQEHREAAEERLAMYDNVVFMEMLSEEASHSFRDSTLDFVYIDGDHRYDTVLRDLQLWWPRLRKSGVLAGHDVIKSYWSDDVQKALIAYFLPRKIKVWLVPEKGTDMPWSYYVVKP